MTPLKSTAVGLKPKHPVKILDQEPWHIAVPVSQEKVTADFTASFNTDKFESELTAECQGAGLLPLADYCNIREAGSGMPHQWKPLAPSLLVRSWLGDFVNAEGLLGDCFG